MAARDDDRESRIRRLLELLREEKTDLTDAVRPFGPAEFTDPDLARRERELIFGSVPTIVAHRSQLPRPNDFITLAMPRNKVILMRQKDGTVKAFVNACRHRGAMLEEAPAGRCRIFSCGYHRWSYDPDGSLRTVTYEESFGEFDRSRLGLVELPVEERHGFIWLVDRAGASIDVAGWLGEEMDSALAGYGIESLVNYREETFLEPVNWKIMQDAFLDGYHIKYAHPNTAGKIIHTNVLAVEDYGRHARFLSARKTLDRWLEEDPTGQSLAKDVTESHYVGPNSTLLRLPDHFELLTFRPHETDPAQCYMQMRVMVPTVEESGLEQEAWDRRWTKNWDILLAVLHGEDFPLLRASQQAVGSADAGDLLIGRNEVVNQIFHREIWRLLDTGADRS
ncbi:aromatic ring-hydroxylating dioxygenase subunit alpha [Actinomadura geliboluensis]|uniref:aromatic ring-hydroxylating oxygenase subunit alpha n=1 Tax=Actinomadura geliboluensis TaxID=882440 RepID=UPI003711E54D